MELTQLKYLLTTVNCGQIVKAAEILHVSQSAVSMAITRLEKELGTKLFEKQGRNIRLTRNGIMFVDMITSAVAELDFAEKQMLLANHEEPDTITLTVEMPDFATTLERIYLKINPKTRFRQAMDTTESAQLKLVSEQVDFCLSFEPIRARNITSIEVLNEPVLIQLRKDHPIANEKQISLSALDGTPFVSFSPEYSFRRWTDGMCFLAGIRPDVVFEACETQSLETMVNSYGAATFIPLSTQYMNEKIIFNEAAAALGTLTINAVPLTDSFCSRHAFLSYHKNRILSKDAQAFLNFVLQFRVAMEQYKNIEDAEKYLLAHQDSSAELPK